MRIAGTCNAVAQQGVEGTSRLCLIAEGAAARGEEAARGAAAIVGMVGALQLDVLTERLNAE